MAHASIKITADAKSYSSQMKSAAEQMKVLSAEYTTAATKVKLFGSKTDALKDQVAALTSKITLQTSIVKMNRESQETLTKKLSDQKTQQKTLKSKIDEAKSAYEKSTEETGKNSEQSKKLKEELEKLENEFKTNETAIGKTETALSKQAVKTEKAKTELMKMEKELKDVNKELKNHKLDTFAKACDKAGKKAEKFGKKMSVVSAGIGGIAAAAVKTAADFDEAMSNVQAISGGTSEDMEKLREKAREMGEKTKFSATEAGDAMSYMAMAGWKTEDMLNGIEGIMTLAAASGEDLSSTSDIVTDAMTGFGLAADGTSKVIKDGLVKEVSNATRFADVLAAASSNSNTNVSMLGESFKYVAPVAGSLGYSVEDTSIALGLMANSGIKASQSGTAMRTMLTNLAKPTDKMAAAMDYLGISLQNEDGSMKSLMDLMKDLRESFGGCKMPMEEFQKQLQEVQTEFENGDLTQKEYNTALNDLTEKAYGAEGALKAKYAATIAGKEGMSGLLAIVGASDKDFSKLTNAIYGSDGAAQSMAATMQDNLKGQLQILKSQTEELGISMGTELMPYIRDGVGHIQNIVDKFNSMSKSEKDTVIKTGLVVAAVGPLAIGFGKVAKGISSTVKTGKQLVSATAGIIAKITAKTAATTAGTAADAAGATAEAAHAAATTAAATTTGGMTAAQTALNLAMSLCPIILIVTLIAGLIAAGVALYKNWDTVKEKMTALWNKIKEVFGKIKECITGAFSKAKDAVKNKVKEMGNAVKNSPIGKVTSKVFDGVKSVISKSTSAAVAKAKENLNNMKKAYKENGGGIKGVVAAGWEGIKGYYSSGFKFVDKLTNGKLSAIKKAFTDKFGEIKKKVSETIEKVKKAFNFKWSLPKLKLPHISVTGGEAPFGIGGKGSLPKFSIEWYKSGGIMTKPTAFGINGSSLMVGGEAGAEAILPLSEFYTRFTSILDKKLEVVNRNQVVNVTSYTYIDGEEVASRTVSKVDEKMVRDKRKVR